MAVFCVSCGAQAPDDGIFCEECGMKLESPAADAVPTVACPNCGAANPPDAAFCEECGTPIPEDAEKGGRKPGFLGTAAKVGLGGMVTGGVGIGAASVLGGEGGGAAAAGATGAAAETAAEASAEAAADAAGSAIGGAGSSGSGAAGGATGGAPGGATGGMPGGAPGGAPGGPPGALGGDVPVKPPLSQGPAGPAPGPTGTESTLGGAPGTAGGAPPGGATGTTPGGVTAPGGTTTPPPGGGTVTSGGAPPGSATGTPPGGGTATGGAPGTTGAPPGGATGAPTGSDAGAGTVVDNVRTVHVTRPGSPADATGTPPGATATSTGSDAGAGAGTVVDNVRTVQVTRPHPGTGSHVPAGGIATGTAAGAGAAAGAAGGAGLSLIGLLGGIVKWGMFSVIGLVGLGLGATIVGGVLIFTGDPSPCVDREIEPSTAASDALREQWDAFEEQAASGKAVITFDEVGVTSRGVEYIEEKDIPLEDLQVHFCPDGLGEAMGTITTPGPDIHVLLRGTLDLSGDKPKIDVREIKAGNLPDVFGGTEWIVNNVVKKSDADILDIDTDLLSLEITDGSATLTGGP